MRPFIVTLRFSPTLAAFDTAPLVEFVRDKNVIDFRTWFFVVGDVPSSKTSIDIRGRRRRSACDPQIRRCEPEPSAPDKEVEAIAARRQFAERRGGLIFFAKNLQHRDREHRGSRLAGVALWSERKTTSSFGRCAPRKS